MARASRVDETAAAGMVRDMGRILDDRGGPRAHRQTEIGRAEFILTEDGARRREVHLMSRDCRATSGGAA